MVNEKFQQRYGTWAMVLGAAQGLGESFANQLASRGVNICLVDMQLEALAHVATQVQQVYHVETHTIEMDLSIKEAVPLLMEWTTTVDCRLFVYSAAYGPVKMFLDNEPDELDHYIDTNARCLLQLSHAFSRHLTTNKLSGGMIFMSSLAGLWGTSLVSPYGATKAFDWNLGEALNYELAPFDIDVLAVCAGAMSTPNYISTGPKYSTFKPKVHRPDYVVEQSIRSLGKKALLIPGFSNKITYFLLGRLLPRAWAVRVLNSTMLKMYKSKWQPQQWKNKT